MSKYRVISGPYFPVFGLNTGKYGPEITLYLDTFHAVPLTDSLTMDLKITRFFLDSWEAFDKVWNEGLLCKLKQNDNSGDVSKRLTDLLYQRKQRVVLNGTHSSWANVKAVVTQRSILDLF